MANDGQFAVLGDYSIEFLLANCLNNLLGFGEQKFYPMLKKALFRIRD